jgi:predicted nucleic acid-binding protein
VYLDSSVLGHWLLYNKAKEPELIEAPKRVKNSLLLLDQINDGYFSCLFETSDFAYAELYQVLRDNIIADKIVKDSQSLVYFHELKSGYDLTEEERWDVDYYLDEFNDLLKDLNVVPYIMQLDMRYVERIIVNLNLSTPDAIHLAHAASDEHGYDYFVTCDRDFLDFREKIDAYVQKPKIASPSELHLKRELRAKNKPHHPQTQHG